MNDVEMNLDLPFTFKLTHIHRKDMFGYNWQLNEDRTPLFIKHAHNWVFNGIPKDQRTNVMTQVWDLVKHNYDSNHFLNKVKSKLDDKDTTSRKFKEDLITTFDNHKDKVMLELGCNRGHTTRVYASLFKKVIAVERSEQNINIAKDVCKDVDNVEFIKKDVYDADFELPYSDIVHIDAGHSHEEVLFDINRCLEKLNRPTLIFDDVCEKLYPNGEIGKTIRTAIDESVRDGKISIQKYIGEDKGYTTGNGKVLLGREGVVCNV
jgi:SAM-dependent methyltransferase